MTGDGLWSSSLDWVQGNSNQPDLRHLAKKRLSAPENGRSSLFLDTDGCPQPPIPGRKESSRIGRRPDILRIAKMLPNQRFQDASCSSASVGRLSMRREDFRTG